MLRLFDRWVVVTFWAFVLVASTVAFPGDARGFTTLPVPPPPAEEEEVEDHGEEDDQPPPLYPLPEVRECLGSIRPSKVTLEVTSGFGVSGGRLFLGKEVA